MKRQANCVARACLFSVALFTVPAHLVAGPDPGVIDGNTATFSGDQSEGVWCEYPAPEWSAWKDLDFSVGPVTTLVIEDLVGKIEPLCLDPEMYITQADPGVLLAHRRPHASNGSDGLIGENGSAGWNSVDLTLQVMADPWWWSEESQLGGFLRTANPSGHGMTVQTTGGEGGDGGDGYGGGYVIGGDGGRGGNGAAVTATIVTGTGEVTDPSSPCWIDTYADHAHGVFTLSRGGRGGDGGDAWGAGYVEGGDGGPGGNGGTITLDVLTHIRTLGSSSHGILAQSLGGASGAGGDGGGLFGGGGAGSDSGRGGPVDVTNRNPILTRGIDALGILAQSIGGYAAGGGGGGGIVFWGGSGASSGDGGPVAVSNEGAIETRARAATAIEAQSIGGGGGNGGTTGGLTAIGGDGAAGGHGGTVSVTNHAALQVAGDDALGISAQSIGSGGGTGAGAGGLFTLGGSGDGAGNGAAVSVVNTAAITTGGGNADALCAQSIGGGGGRAATPGGAFTVGGSGGGSGGGGPVDIINSGPLQTTAANACGLFAHSIGGGGGRGGSAYGVMPLLSCAIGGAAAIGADGGDVTIGNDATTIATEGHNAYGIHGQSIGGGGGSGGNVLSVTAGVQFTGTASIGGAGGAGGSGGEVVFTNAGQVTTLGDQTHALFAESIGGGGGSGGNAVALAATVGTGAVPAVSFSMVVGGNGGDGGTGGPVSVSHTGEATAAGRRACGIVGQSIGGGGGDGGYSVSGGLTFDTLAATLSIGGAGGEGGNGGTVGLAGDGTVQTQGEAAYGLLAQSIGGGGGAGGDAVALTINLPDFRNLLAELVTPNMNTSLSVGGQGGHGGTGGAVNITSDGLLGTQGVYAHGIVAQSIGGGGGAGADAYALDFDVIPDPPDLTGLTEQIGLGADVAIGGSNGAAGHGGPVEVTRGGELTTEADFAQGILAQSVGGGGGTSGVAIDDPYDLIDSTGSSSVLRCRAGGSGSGGAVTVTHSGQITTRGRFAHGILAQSVGGGGGFGAIGEAALTSALDEGADIAGLKLHDHPGLGVAFVGSCGGSGSAEAVTVTHSGRIETFGDLSHGILAQSASGRGNTGAVTVTVDGDVLAHGADAHSILAQSLSDYSAAPFTITIHAGSVVRGGTAGGAGVVVEGAGPWSLTNNGEIGSLGGIALLGGDGDDVIDNYGTISGEIDLGRGTSVEMTNHEGARFNTGSAVRLGLVPETSASLTNAGTLSPGGPDHCFNEMVSFDGNLVLAATSVLEIDVDGMMTSMWGGDYLMIYGDVLGDDGLPPGGTIRFNFLPSYDVDAEVGPGQTAESLFLGWWTMPVSPAFAYDFQGCPDYFDYEVLLTEWGTWGEAVLRYTNTRTFGDADDDGDVDLDDFAALKRGFGTGTAWAEGDFDGDHDVDLDDFMILKAHFGTAAVPEPATWAALALGAMVGLRRRR